MLTNTMDKVFLVPLFLAIMSLSGVNAAQVIEQRLNYGVVYEHHATVSNSEQEWHHTIQIPLPAEYGTGTPEDHRYHCVDSNSSACGDIRHLADQFVDLRNEVSALLHNTTHEIETIIPSVEQLLGTSRKRRAVLGFVGDIAHTLFGTARSRDLKKLVKHVNELTNFTKQLSGNFQAEAAGLASFMELVDKRMTNTMAAVQRNHEYIVGLSYQIKGSIEDSESRVLRLMTMYVQQEAMARKIRERTKELLLGVHELLNGKLSQYLVPSQVLLSVISTVDDQVGKKYPGFRVAETHPRYYYSFSKFVFARHESSLYITMNFPVTSSTLMFDVYKVIAYPLPVNQSTTHATILLDLPDYFAIAQDKYTFIELSEAKYALCSGMTTKHCYTLFHQRQASSPTCASAIFNNQHKAVMSQCNFRFSVNGSKSLIDEIAPGQIFLSNIFDLTLKCHNGDTRHLVGCTACIIHVPCDCSVDAGPFHLPRRINQCHHNTSSLSTYYPVNLAVLRSYYSEDSKVDAILGDSIFSSPMNFDPIPDFHIFQHDFASHVAADQTMHLSLEQMIQDAKNNQTTYRSLSDPIFSGTWAPYRHSWFNFSNVMSLLMSICIVCLAAYCFNLTINMRNVQLAMTLLEAKCGASASNIPNLMEPFDLKSWGAAVSSSGSSDSMDEHIVIKIDSTTPYIVIAILVSLLIMVLLAAIVHLYKRLHHKSELQLLLTNGIQCHTITLLKSPLCPRYWELPSDLKLQGIHLTSKHCQSWLQFRWGGGYVLNKLSGDKQRLAIKSSISPWHINKVKVLLASDYTVTLQYLHNGQVQPVP